MLLRVGLIGLCLASLSACNTDLSASGNTIGALHTETVEFSKTGGDCPQPPKKIPDNAKCASVKITYPKFSSTTKPELADTLNAFVQDQLLDTVDENGQRPTSLETLANGFIGDYLKQPSAFSSWTLERTIKIAYASEDLVTLLYSEDGNTGGAHPFSGQRYYVMNLQNGQQMTLKDLLNPGYEGEINVIAEQAFRDSRNIAPDVSLEGEGFWFQNNTFAINNNFGILEDGLAFHFNTYEVAPYAMGASEFTIPYEDIMGLIPPNSPITKIGD